MNTKITAATLLNSLITDHTIINTTSGTAIDTYDSRKFSNYRFLLFTIGTSASYFRGTSFLPSSMWKSGGTVFVGANHGTDLENCSGIYFSYNSDTKITVSLGGAKQFNHVQVLGISIY